jgi:hypothetical protein
MPPYSIRRVSPVFTCLYTGPTRASKIPSPFRPRNTTLFFVSFWSPCLGCGSPQSLQPIIMKCCKGGSWTTSVIHASRLRQCWEGVDAFFRVIKQVHNLRLQSTVMHNRAKSVLILAYSTGRWIPNRLWDRSWSMHIMQRLTHNEL